MVLFAKDISLVDCVIIPNVPDTRKINLVIAIP